MAMRNYRPITPGQRFKQTADLSEVTKSFPEKRLLRAKKRGGGRNNQGCVTVRWRGGGHKRSYRIIDFRREKLNIPGKVVGIEYDPNRGARIALISYADGEKRYIIAPQKLVVGSTIMSGPSSDIKAGNTLAISDIPVGEMVHNIELRPGKGGVIARGAGTGAQLMAKDGGYALLRLPSGEQRRVLLTCKATIGVVSNPERANRSLGKAGVNRWLGKLPAVRGVAQNPVDHPHGGGEGKTSGGRHPVSPWGQPTKGYKTRNSKRTDKFIASRRK